MLLYPLTIPVSVVLWALFADAAVRGLPAGIVWALFGVSLVGVLWVVHEGVRLAIPRRRGRSHSPED